MVPAQFVPGAVAVLANTGAESRDLRDERLAIEVPQVFVHIVCS